MKYVILADGTRIDNCNDSTTVNSIFAVRDSYGNAAAVRDLFSSANAKNITVYDEEDKVVTSGADLVLVDGVSVAPGNSGFVAEITTRVKSHDEIIEDQIAELQEAVLGE